MIVFAKQCIFVFHPKITLHDIVRFERLSHFISFVEDNHIKESAQVSVSVLGSLCVRRGDVVLRRHDESCISNSIPLPILIFRTSTMLSTHCTNVLHTL